MRSSQKSFPISLREWKSPRFAMAAAPSTIIFADDLTGALEVGVLARLAGHSTHVLLGGAPPAIFNQGMEVVVANTGMRDHSKEQAAERFRLLPGYWPDAGRAAVLLKTDSLLRGHVAATIAFLRRTWPRRATVFAPAYPMMGRVVRNGRLIASVLSERAPDGVDLLGLLAESIPREQIRLVPDLATLRDALLQPDGSLLVCDGERQEDVEAMGALLSQSLSDFHVAGPAGVFRGLFRPNYSAPPAHAPPLLVGAAFIGSVHPVSNEQVLRLRADSAMETLRTERCETREESLAAWSRAQADERWLLVAPFESILEQHTDRWLAPLAEPLAALSEKPSQFPPALLLSGGETARIFLQLLHIGAVEPQCEVIPGIALSTARWRGRTLWIATKSGAFGGPDALIETIHRLRAGSNEGGSEL